MSSVTVRRPEGPIRARIALPKSKSIANRALVLAALAGDLSCVKDPGDAEDTRILQQLLHDRPRVMHCGLGGTTFRFLLAWASVQEGAEHVITGDAPLLERPHKDLIEGLRHLGADITRTAEGYRVKGRRLSGGSIAFDSPISSQYLSALLLIAPGMANGLRIDWKGTQLSRPYVEMTVRTLRHFGAQVEVGDRSIYVHAGPCKAVPLEVPPDWSAASFWYEIVALADDAEVELSGLVADGWQGDEVIGRHMIPWVEANPNNEGMRLRSWRDQVRVIEADIDLAPTPDLFQPLAFTYAARGAHATFSGLDNLSVKETDRLAAVEEALRTLGIPAERAGTRFRLPGRTDRLIAPRATHIFDPCGDHRMAMALAPLALVAEAITIADRAVVAKSYPGFWDDLRKAGFIMH